MKTSVLLNSALALSLCVSTGCATRRRVVVQDPGFTPPVAEPAPTEPVVVTPVLPPVEPPPKPALPKPSPLPAEATSPALPSGPAQTVVTEPPPPPHVEVVRASPGPRYIWMPGYWEWKNGWSWVDGRWVISPRANASWIPGRWVRRSQGGWIWVKGYWR